MATLCLGEALVDLVCESPVDDLSQATSFVPHFGGAMANVAVTAARAGAAVQLAGGAGDDAWGAWLRGRLEAEGVGLEGFRLVTGAATAVAFVTVDADAQPSFLIHGDTIGVGVEAAGPHLPELVEQADALVITSNTLVGETERALTMAARERALALGVPVIVDPNFRLHRWPSTAQAVEATRACLDGAFLVKLNEEEGRLLTGEIHAAGVAGSLVSSRVQHAVVTRGAEGAVLRGPGMRFEVPGVPAATVDTTGAGDVLLGTLVAELAKTRFYPASLAAGLPIAVAAAARATERWGAVG
ncbi:hypothetical protein GKE82_13450 [Conexibacter sp. W3-3-2]|uniref:Carbohydrate kinase PfkB domain-containing protein n=1 Tax=Paraconexibacter algicola TaxID=2133960 RepID=A0A2T4UI95_9ACTN|nr:MULTISPECIES: PfkB family carbohydrate kinase [Solirubrobacterales]MTD45264.1 hypothetical protein [Conexibacter sp. W3-3-2]PTL58962.1 hypothetical protein C7Y72_04515 [Paraconexibacter algicola]